MEKALPSSSNISFQSNNLTDIEKKVVDYFRTHKKASRKEIQIAIKKSQTFTIEVLKTLLQKKIILREGNNRSFVYLLASDCV